MRIGSRDSSDSVWARLRDAATLELCVSEKNRRVEAQWCLASCQLRGTRTCRRSDAPQHVAWAELGDSFCYCGSAKEQTKRSLARGLFGGQFGGHSFYFLHAHERFGHWSCLHANACMGDGIMWDAAEE